MNKEELLVELQPFYAADGIGISLYAILKGEDQGPKRLDIEDKASEQLKEMFLRSMREAVIENTDASVMNLSDSDERKNAIYEYDLEVPEELAALQEVTEEDNIGLLGLANSTLTKIKALIVEIGDNERQLVLYKTIASINIFSRSSFFLKKAATRLEQISDEFLRVNPGFQFFSVSDTLFVMDVNSLEKRFGFHDIIRREAEAGVDSIEGMELIENPEVLRESINDIKFARRLTKVASSSPVIGNVGNDSIILFCKQFPNLAGKIRFNQNENKILLDTQVSKDLFLKLLMDNYLTSELTRLHYESLAKDSAEVDDNDVEG